MKSKLPLAFFDYARIFKVAYSALRMAGASPYHSCLAYSLIGAQILDDHFNLKATVTAGAAAYVVDTKGPAPDVLLFGRFEDNFLHTDEESFHAWVECEGHIVDFMSPMFVECVKEMNSDASVSRFMFQKPHTSAASSLDLLKRKGDFLLLPDLPLTHRLADDLEEVALNRDLMNLCSHFFRRHPKPWPKEMSFSDSVDGVRQFKLQAPDVTGAW